MVPLVQTKTGEHMFKLKSLLKTKNQNAAKNETLPSHVGTADVTSMTLSHVEHFKVILTSSYFRDARTFEFDVTHERKNSIITFKSKG